MNAETDTISPRGPLIAGLLWYGTWFACALIAGGMLWPAIASHSAFVDLPLTGTDLVKAGVATLILLPVARVILMLGLFLRARDALYALLALLVLIVIALGIVLQR